MKTGEGTDFFTTKFTKNTKGGKGKNRTKREIEIMSRIMIMKGRRPGIEPPMNTDGRGRRKG